MILPELLNEQEVSENTVFVEILWTNQWYLMLDTSIQFNVYVHNQVHYWYKNQENSFRVYLIDRLIDRLKIHELIDYA